MTALEQLQAEIDAAGLRVPVVRMPADRRELPEEAWVVDTSDPGDVVVYGYDRGQLSVYRHAASEAEAVAVLREITVDRPVPRKLTPEEEEQARRSSEQAREDMRRWLAETREGR